MQIRTMEELEEWRAKCAKMIVGAEPMPDEEDDEVPCLYCGSLTRNQDEVCDDSSCQAEAKEQWVSATREDDHEADRVDRALGYYR